MDRKLMTALLTALTISANALDLDPDAPGTCANGYCTARRAAAGMRKCPNEGCLNQAGPGERVCRQCAAALQRLEEEGRARDSGARRITGAVSTQAPSESLAAVTSDSTTSAQYVMVWDATNNRNRLLSAAEFQQLRAQQQAPQSSQPAQDFSSYSPQTYSQPPAGWNSSTAQSNPTTYNDGSRQGYNQGSTYTQAPQAPAQGGSSSEVSSVLSQLAQTAMSFRQSGGQNSAAQPYSGSTAYNNGAYSGGQSYARSTQSYQAQSPVYRQQNAPRMAQPQYRPQPRFAPAPSFGRRR